MDTDHPYFQQAAPEYIESPEDVFLEELEDAGRPLRILFTISQLRLIRQRLAKFAPQSHQNEPQHFQEMVRLNSIFAYIEDASNKLQALDCVAYAFGLLCRDGESMDYIAKRHGVARQAFSDQVGEFQRDFNIGPRSGMRPMHQKKMYEEVQRARQAEIWKDIPPRVRHKTNQLKAA